jgi:hypothetical protein
MLLTRYYLVACGAFGLLQVLGVCMIEQMNKPAYHLFFRLTIFSEAFESFVNKI